MTYHFEVFQFLLHDFIGHNAAIVTPTGQVLALNGPNADASGTLPMAGSIVNRYFHLQKGDVVLLNDPYSGGSTLGEFTFVVGLSENLIWISRQALTSQVCFAKSIEDEGLRIPPTPLRQNGQINKAILQAMAAHPACPSDFEAWLLSQIERLLLHSAKFQRALDSIGFVIDENLIQNYIDLSRKAALRKLHENAFGETRVDVYLDSGELLRVNVNIQDSQIRIDFGGTSSSKNIALTEAATYGVCLSTIGRFYGFQKIANSGSFSVVQVIQPSGCWLNAKYPAPTTIGFHNGVAALECALELALSHIHFKKEKSPDTHCPLKIEWRYQDRRSVLNLTGGQGASIDRPGRAARLQNFSVEQLEKEFPLQVLKINRRQSIQITAKHQGGSGIEMHLKVLAPVEAAWLSDLANPIPRLSKSCSIGEGSHLLLSRNGSVYSLPSCGTQSFETGDILTLISGNGGSYGLAMISTES